MALLEQLEHEAAKDPQALRPHLANLLERGTIWPPSIYRSADDTVRQRLIELVDIGTSGRDLSMVLEALAYAGGPLAETAFRRWGLSSMPDDGSGYTFEQWARAGGWVLLPEAGSRELCGPTADQLVVDGDGELVTGRLRGSRCLWCQSLLWTVLELDPADPRVAATLAHTDWVGRLDVATCYFCNRADAIFWAVGDDGRSEVSAA
jgi:hypothetical protein